MLASCHVAREPAVVTGLDNPVSQCGQELGVIISGGNDGHNQDQQLSITGHFTGITV